MASQRFFVGPEPEDLNLEVSLGFREFLQCIQTEAKYHLIRKTVTDFLMLPAYVIFHEALKTILNQGQCACPSTQYSFLCLG